MTAAQPKADSHEGGCQADAPCAAAARTASRIVAMSVPFSTYECSASA